MRFFKGFILVCVVTSFVYSKGYASEQKTYNIDTFLVNRLSLLNVGSQYESTGSVLQKIGNQNQIVSYSQNLFGENILLLSFFTPHSLSESQFLDHYFLTYPSGKVENISLSGSLFSSGGYLIPNQQITLKIPLLQSGKYAISFFDRYGFSLLNARYQFGYENTSYAEKYRSGSIIEQINTIRTNIGEQKLTEDELLQKLANKKIEDMFEKKYFGHEDMNGNNVVKNISDEREIMLGENLARGSDKELLQQKLEDSGAHRYNMQFSEWTKVGITIRKGPDDMWYMVQIFGK